MNPPGDTASAATTPALSPRAEALDALLRGCIHCGLCISSCPTYRITGDEAESPRGRLMIMGEIEGLGVGYGGDALQGRALTSEHRNPLDHCLGCRNCETVCPSGVDYGRILESVRGDMGPADDPRSRLIRWLVDHVMIEPRRLWMAARLGSLARRLGLARWLPESMGDLLDALPARTASFPRSPSLPREGDVALLAGCAQRVFSPNVLAATAALVEAAGGRPYVPRDQVCCGALSHHAGSTEVARQRARELMDVMARCSSIVVPSAGCSAHIHDYGHLFAGDPAYSEKAKRVSAAAIDLLEWLDQRIDRLRFRADARRVAYHPPCHHRHAQGIVDAPLRLLRSVDGLELVPLVDADRCCGSAGSYSIQQPRLARAVRAEKLGHIEGAAPDLLLTANPGCELFLHQGLSERSNPLPVDHIACYLADRLEPQLRPKLAEKAQ